MKKSILNIGEALNKVEQKSINGGRDPRKCCNPETACCTFEGSSDAYGLCCTVSWTPYKVCFSSGGAGGVECI